MKYAVIMKLYREETIDLKRAILTIFSFLLVSQYFQQLYAQTPVNGFCRYQSFPISEGFHNLVSLNFNGDSYTDIALFDPSRKELITCKGNPDGAFVISKSNRLPHEISDLQLLNKDSLVSCAFISRKSRNAGLLNVLPSGSTSLICEVKLDSYPGGMNLADINSDGTKEILVYGEAFNGLSILTKKGRHIAEKKIFSGKLFSQAVWADLNHDPYPDIAAYDLMTGSLKFLYNNSLGEFYEARQIKSRGKISSILPYDFNLDGFQDLLIVQGKKIHILFGDNVSSFDRTSTLSTEFKPDNVIVSDFNRDGLNDIAYLDKAHSVLCMTFARAAEERMGSFHREIIYLRKSGLSEASAYYSKFISGILSLDTKGRIYLISSLNVIKDNTSLAFGADPSAISYFDAGNNKIMDLCCIDKFRPALNLLVRDNSGIPSVHFSIGLVDTCGSLEIDDTRADEKIFYCYSRGKRLIQAVSVNFRDNRITKDNIYASGPLSDLKVIKAEGHGRKRLYAAVVRRGILALEVFDYINYQYSPILSGSLESNITDARIDEFSPLSIFYWKKGDNCLYFKKLVLDRELKQQMYLNQFTLASAGADRQPPWMTGDIFNREAGCAANFVFDTDNYYAFISGTNKNAKLKLKGDFSGLRIRNSSMLSTGEIRFNGLRKILVYNDADETLLKLDILNRSGILLSTKLAKGKNVESYFVKNMNFKKYHFVYTDKAEKCVTIKELP